MPLCLFFPFQPSLSWLCFVGLSSYVALFSCSSLLRESKMDMDVKESEGIIPKWYFEKKIVIVGAGVSGLSAASELQKLGFKNVVILEAKNTTGGRVRTMHFGSDFIEIGAEWIHGQKGNRVYEIASNHGLVEEHCPDYMESLFKWDHVTDRKQREAISSTLTMLENVMDKIDNHEASGLPKTLEEYLSDQFESYMLLCSDSDQIKLIKRAVYDWFVKLQFELNGCRSLSDVSCKLLQNYKECEGCHVTELKSGYSSFLNVLCKNIPESWIKKNMEVKTIAWKNVSSGTLELDEKMGELQLSDKNKANENHIVSIDCVHGEKYIADHVIVTVPLGYLKKSHGSLFVPPLPSDKVKAIECIGFHSLNKIFLEFDEPFWERHSVFNMLWINEDFKTLVNNGSLHQCPGASWHKFISRFAYVSHHPKMLCAWIVGDGAVFMENLPEKQVLEKCHELLQQQLGRRDIPFPQRIIRSQWGTDPYTYGSYSYLSVGCEDAGITNEELASPITRKFDSSPLLQFAGEATHSSYYSTVHGAYESGIREAHRIFDYYRLSTVVEKKKTAGY